MSNKQENDKRADAWHAFKATVDSVPYTAPEAMPIRILDLKHLLIALAKAWGVEL